MNYEKLRTVVKDGDVIFLKVDKKNFLSKCTSFFTKSTLTHAAFVFWYMNRLMLVESTTHGGIRIVQASTYKDRSFVTIPAPQKWEDVAWKALQKSGTAKYGWLSAAYIGMRDFIFMHFGIRLPPNKNNRNKACSEFVAEVLELADTDISPKLLFETLNK